MPIKTKTLNIRVTETQYDILDELVKRGEYTSKGEFIRELLREKFDDFSIYLHEKAKMDKTKHVPLEEYGKSRGLE
jgi:Arc/MetJ-type ribon-helix-helix transcriptional regulator